MAKLKVFTVYDAKVEAFMAPFTMLTQGQALRGWSDAVNNPETQFSKHPEDFTLFYIADYDEISGKYENLMAPVSIASALEHHQGKKTYLKEIGSNA